MSTRFLICDDQKIRIQEIRQILTANRRNQIIEAFTNGREVADWVKYNPGKADVLVLDIIMPVMDGYAAFFEIKQHDPKLKVIFTSVENSPPLIKELLTNGAAGYLTKPVSREKLLEAVQRATGV